MIRNNTGYSNSELISRIYTGCYLPFNFNPKYLSQVEDQEKLDKFFSIGNFNANLFFIEKGMGRKEDLIAELKFENDFKKAIENPTFKTLKAADFYPIWF